MNPLTHTAIWRLAKVGIVLLAALGFSQGAFATLAADHKIRNTVKVTFDDAGGNVVAGVGTELTASVDIVVNLVIAAPDVVNVTTQDLTNLSPGQVATLQFEVTSNANGDDQYSFFNIDGTDGTNTGSTFGVANTVDLGGTSFGSQTTITGDTGGPNSFDTGTAALGSSFGTLLTVPSDADGSAGDPDVSGFANGDIIVLKTTGAGNVTVVCRVNTVVDSGLAPALNFNATASIYVDDCGVNSLFSVGSSSPAAAVLTSGDQMGERQILTATLTAGNTPNADTLLGTIGPEAGTDTTTGSIPYTVVAANLVLKKFVRYVSGGGSNPSCTGASFFECLTIKDSGGDQTYYASGVTADPNAILEYAILMYNQASLVTDVKGNDPIVLFTNFVAGSVKLYDEGVAANGGSNCHDTNGTCTVSTNGLAGGGALTAAVGDETDSGAGNDFVFLNTTPEPDELVFAGGHISNSPPTDETAGGQIDSSSGTTNNVSVLVFQVQVAN